MQILLIGIEAFAQVLGFFLGAFIGIGLVVAALYISFWVFGKILDK